MQSSPKYHSRDDREVFRAWGNWSHWILKFCLVSCHWSGDLRCERRCRLQQVYGAFSTTAVWQRMFCSHTQRWIYFKPWLRRVEVLWVQRCVCCHGPTATTQPAARFILSFFPSFLFYLQKLQIHLENKDYYPEYNFFREALFCLCNVKHKSRFWYFGVEKQVIENLSGGNNSS